MGIINIIMKMLVFFFRDPPHPSSRSTSPCNFFENGHAHTRHKGQFLIDTIHITKKNHNGTDTEDCNGEEEEGSILLYKIQCLSLKPVKIQFLLP